MREATSYCGAQTIWTSEIKKLLFQEEKGSYKEPERIIQQAVQLHEAQTKRLELLCPPQLDFQIQLRFQLQQKAVFDL